MLKFDDLSICIVCHSVRIDGGIGRYVVELIEALNERNIRPTVFTKKIDNNTAKSLNCDIIRINCKWLPTKLRDHYFNFVVGRKIKKYNFDEIISANRFPLSTIMICGGTHRGYLFNMRKRASLFDKLMIRLEEKCYRNSKLIVAHSKGLKDEVVNLYNINKDKVKVIYTPLDKSKFNVTASSVDDIKIFKEKFNIPKENTVFLIPSAGNHMMKGLDILQNYFNNSNLPITLVVAGRKVENGRNVRYIGFRSDMEKMYNIVDYTILASRYEAFGMVAIESIFCGTPVVLSENVYAQEIIKPSEKIMFNIYNENSLDNAIRVAIESKHRVINPEDAVTQKDSKVDHICKIFKEIGYTI